MVLQYKQYTGSGRCDSRNPTLIRNFLWQFWRAMQTISIDKSYIKSVKLKMWNLSSHNLLQK